MGMIARSNKWGRGGYVLLQEQEKDMTQRLKRLSLQQLEQRLVETPASYGKTLILRKLTPKEKERLMGFPEGWTEDLPTDGRRGKGLGNAIVPNVVAVLFAAIPLNYEKAC